MSKVLCFLVIVLMIAGPFQMATPARASGNYYSTVAQVDPSKLPYFGEAAFQRVWDRTDLLVAAGTVKRSWYWGPRQVSGPIYEKLNDRTRLVQYFEKTRMEINNPNGDRNSPFFVTNGLLTRELISGQVQTGEQSFEPREPSTVPIAGDGNDTTAPTYASFAAVSTTSDANNHPQPNRMGQSVTATINKSGTVGNDPSKASLPGLQVAYFDAGSKHNVPRVFWDFLNATGNVVENLRVVNKRINDPWFYASGLPISDAYWTRVKIAGTPTDVLVQAFERRVLTYVPSNPDPNFRVEMGNIGLHYVQWRYPDPKGLPGQAAVYKSEGAGGQICRALTAGANACSAANANSTPPMAGYYEDLIKTSTGGILNARTQNNKFRLLADSQLRLKSNYTLNVAESFLLSVGQALFDHENAQGEIVVESGSTRIEPIDTKFSVKVNRDRSVKVVVVEGQRGVRVTPGSGQAPIMLGEEGRQEQLRISAAGVTTGPEGMDAESRRVWETYGCLNCPDGPDLSGTTGAFNRSSCEAKVELFPRYEDRHVGCPLEPAVRYGGSDGFTGAVAYYESSFGDGYLLQDTPSETYYALYADPGSGAGTWESITFDGNLEDFAAAHPEVIDRLGKESDLCEAPDWELQRFAGATLVHPPIPRICSSGDSSMGLVLYSNGDWHSFFSP
jgi:hypothetical protein